MGSSTSDGLEGALFRGFPGLQAPAGKRWGILHGEEAAELQVEPSLVVSPLWKHTLTAETASGATWGASRCNAHLPTEPWGRSVAAGGSWGGKRFFWCWSSWWDAVPGAGKSHLSLRATVLPACLCSAPHSCCELVPSSGEKEQLLSSPCCIWDLPLCSLLLTLLSLTAQFAAFPHGQHPAHAVLGLFLALPLQNGSGGDELLLLLAGM